MDSNFKLDQSVAEGLQKLNEQRGFDMVAFINKALKVAVEAELPRQVMTKEQREADKIFAEAVKSGERIRFV